MNEKAKKLLRAERKKELWKLRAEVAKFSSPELLTSEEIQEVDRLNVRIRELKDDLVKDLKITIAVTRRERDRLKRNAAAADLTLNKYLITCGLKKRPPLAADQAEFLKEVREQVRRIGVNLNELVKETNAASISNRQPPSEAALTETLIAVKNLLEKISNTL